MEEEVARAKAEGFGAGAFPHAADRVGLLLLGVLELEAEAAVGDAGDDGEWHFCGDGSGFAGLLLVELEVDGLAVRQPVEAFVERGSDDPSPVDAEDDVPALEAGLGRGASGLDALDENAPAAAREIEDLMKRWVDRLELQADQTGRTSS